MSWIDSALISTMILGVVVTLDSHIICRRVPSLWSYLLLCSFCQLLAGSLLFYFIPLPKGTSLEIILLGLLPGTIRGIGLTLMTYVMQREQISQIIPVVFSYPIFVAIIAIPLLGETLNFLQWLAIFIVVAGAVMISAKKSPTGSTRVLGKTFLLLFGVSIFLSIADTTTKYVLSYFSPWNMLAFSTLSMFIVFFTVSIRPKYLREVSTIWQRHSNIPLIILNQTLAPTGMAFLLWAMQNGPISLVSTINGSRPIFVAIYAIILNRIAPGFLLQSAGGGLLLLRLIATVMIVTGISIIYLT